MKQTILATIIAMLLPSESFSEGVFGLKKGMTVDEVRKLGFRGVMYKDKNMANWWVIERPSKPKGVSAIELWIPPDIGLLNVRFLWSVKTGIYGAEAKRKFRELHEILSAKYGEGTKFNTLRDGSVLGRPDQWTMALLMGHRKLAWVQNNFDATNPWDMHAIMLQAKAITQTHAGILLHYEFQGFVEYKERKEAEQASQF